jgi:hypothetical protein
VNGRGKKNRAGDFAKAVADCLFDRRSPDITGDRQDFAQRFQEATVPGKTGHCRAASSWADDRCRSPVASLTGRQPQQIQKNRKNF